MGTDLDLKIADQPGVVANLKQEIVNSLASQFTLTASQQTILYDDIKISSDNYETVNCGMTGPQGPPGPTRSYWCNRPTRSIWFFRLWKWYWHWKYWFSSKHVLDNIYIRNIHTLDGESKDSTYQNAIDILSYQFGADTSN